MVQNRPFSLRTFSGRRLRNGFIPDIIVSHLSTIRCVTALPRPRRFALKHDPVRNAMSRPILGRVNIRISVEVNSMPQKRKWIP